MQVLGDDCTVFVNQYGMRDAVDTIKSGTAVLPTFQVGQLCPGDVRSFTPLAHASALLSNEIPIISNPLSL